MNSGFKNEKYGPEADHNLVDDFYAPFNYSGYDFINEEPIINFVDQTINYTCLNYELAFSLKNKLNAHIKLIDKYKPSIKRYKDDEKSITTINGLEI